MQSTLFDDDTPTPGPMPWEEAAARDVVVADVALDRPLDDAFSYVVPDGLRDDLQAGQRVRVPFGRGDKTAVGFAVAVRPWTAADRDPRKLKSVAAVVDPEPLVDGPMLGLTKWIAEYYLCGWGQVLTSVVPAGVKSQAGTRLYKFVAIADDGRKALEIGSLRPKQQAVLSLLAGRDEPWRADKLAASAECGSGVILNLEKKGLVEAVRLRDDNLTFKEGPAEPHTAVELTDEQRAALDAILRAIRGDPAEAIPGRQPGDASDSPGNSSDRGNERLTALPDIRGLTPPGSPTSRTILLHGVTGSGKTEVYIRAIEEVVSYGRQAIVLVPEISLTPQTIRRFRSRFKGVAVLHSHLTDAERHHQWRRIARGEIQVVVGARSAVFAPTPRLGLIVIDEEHETSFKQDTTPRYHAREVAERRAAAAAVPLILGSATPTLESWRRAATGRYRLVSMPSRVDDLPMPPVTIVDVRNDPQIKKGHAIGRVLESTMRTALGDDGQVILFLNVRGHSPAVWCPACGASLKCLDCDITLTWHKDLRLNLCHSCGVESEVPRSCPECGHTGLKFVGIGTQKLEAEVRAKFAGVPLARMDSDAMKKPGSHDEVLSAFRSGDLKILLGTQMIAKGLDFPNVTLVGVVDADTTLRQPDLRASERTFQLIAQVAGRTGRSRRGGRVLVQSSSPAEPAIRLTRDHDYVTFARGELADREVQAAPPFRHVARLVIRGPDEAAVRRHAVAVTDLFRDAAKSLASKEGPAHAVRVLGPAPCPITRLKGLWRFHAQLSAADPADIGRLWRATRERAAPPKPLEMVLDVDAVSMR